MFDRLLIGLSFKISVFQANFKPKKSSCFFVPEQMFVLFGSYLNRLLGVIGLFWDNVGRSWYAWKTPKANVGATDRMLAVQVDQILPQMTSLNERRLKVNV